MKKLPKKITNEIRKILEGCRDGELKHKQSEYHCGTAHCIAGWKAAFDYAKVNKDKSILTANFDREVERYDEIGRFMNAKHSTYFEDIYAQKQWRLTDTEANALFEMRATFDEQFALLEKLENGLRVI